MGVAPPPSEQRRAELADFLRGRRAQIAPEDAGFPPGARRRTPGLRREEVAQLAGVGISWYTWLEQGRDIRPSPQVLDAIARVLRLDDGERAHLFHLARVELPLPAATASDGASEDLVALVDELVPLPAYLITTRTDVVAWNRVASAVIGEPTRAPDGRRNLLWWLFTRPEPLTAQIEETARTTLARFRAEHARRMDDPDFAALIDALDAASERFRALWPEHEVLTGQQGRKTIEHPRLGPLHLRHVQFVPTEHADLRLTQFTPLDAATRAALERI